MSSGYAQPRPELTVFGASDLAFALKEIAAKFEQAHDAKVNARHGLDRQSLTADRQRGAR